MAIPLPLPTNVGAGLGALFSRFSGGYTAPVAADTGGSGGGQGTAGGNKLQLLQAVNSDGSLSTQDRTALLAWLNGETLADPRLSAWVLRNSPGGLPSGAGVLQGVQAQAQAQPSGQGAGWQPATGNGAPGVGAAGGLPPGDYAFSQQADPAAPLPPTGGDPTTGGGNPVTGAGGPSELATASLWENQKGQANRYAARAAGIDSDQGGLASDYFSHYTDPLIKALAPLFAYTQGGGAAGSPGDVDPAAYQKYLGGFGQAMVTPGQSGFGMSRQAAQQVLANPDFMAQLLGGTDSAQQEELLNLQHLQHPLASPLAQNYLNTQSTRLANRYTDASLGLLPGSSVNQYGGKFTNFLDQDKEGRALAQRLFGYVPR